MLRRIRLRITAWCYGLFMYEVFLGPAKLSRLLRHAFRIYNLITTAQGVYITDMKKLFQLLCLGLSLTVAVSCSEKDDLGAIIQPNDEEALCRVWAEETITSFSIKAEGDWSASVISEDSEWVYLITTKGNGNGDVLFSVGENDGEIAREAVVRISNATSHADYTIRQFVDNDNTQYQQTSDLGFGVNVNPTDGNDGIHNFKKTSIFKNNVFNNPDYVYLYNKSKFTCELQDMVEYQNEERNIGANLKLDISYGLFKLGLSGSFKMYGAQKDSSRCYGAVVKYPVRTLKFNYSGMDDYLSINDDDLQHNEERAEHFNSAFLNYHDNIEKLVEDGTELTWAPKKDKNDPQWQLWNNLELLNKKYGPMFITSVEYGGSAEIDFRVTESVSTDTLAIRGKLNASFNRLFSFDVEVAATYDNYVKGFMKGSTLRVTVNGGSLSAQKKLTDSLAPLTTGKDFNVPTITEALVVWAESVKSESSDIEATSFSTMAIWELFTDDAADVIKEYFKQKYPNTKDEKGNVVCPYAFNVEALASM